MARLLREFDLATEDGNNLDMSEDIGVLIRKATPLKVILTPNYHPIYIPQGLIVALRKNKERHWCFLANGFVKYYNCIKSLKWSVSNNGYLDNSIVYVRSAQIF